MADDPEVLALKQDPAAMCQAFGVPRLAYHNPCPFCGDKDALSLFHKKDTSFIFYKCHKCNNAGTVFEAIMRLHGCTFPQAKEHLLGRRTTPLPKPIPPKPRDPNKPIRDIPVLDLDKTEKLVAAANNFLLDNLQFVKDYKRGLSEAVIQKYRIGLLYDTTWRLYDSGAPHRFRATWVIPVTDLDGVVRGVKLHHQMKPVLPNGKEFEAKCNWAPFGTEPKQDREKGIQPNHSYYTLWPHPSKLDTFDPDFTLDPVWWVNQIDKNSDLYERWHLQLQMEQSSIAYALGIHVKDLEPHHIGQSFTNSYSIMGKEIRRHVQQARGKIALREPDPTQVEPDPDEYIFLCPGELKGLALESEGFRAVTMTGGESWTPTADEMEWFRGRRVCLPYDDDVTIEREGRLINAGRKWGMKMTQILRHVRAKEIIAIPGGQKVVGKIEPPPPPPPPEVNNEEEFTI